MLNAHPFSRDELSEEAVVLRAPQSGDAWSFTLLAAYDRAADLPEDFRSMLMALDQTQLCPRRQQP